MEKTWAIREKELREEIAQKIESIWKPEENSKYFEDSLIVAVRNHCAFIVRNNNG